MIKNTSTKLAGGYFLNTKLLKVSLFVTIIMALGSCANDKIEVLPCDDTAIKFSADIHPIIITHCAVPGCHVAGFSKGDYTTYEGIKEKADNGRLYTNLVTGKMPKAGTVGPEKISDCDKNRIYKWIDDGAQDN